MILHPDLNLRETLRLARTAEQAASSRFRLGSPCKFIRAVDVVVHLVLPELLEDLLPGLARYLRRTSPRWGRSWRGW